ncbi:MAG: oligosaccharide flippase family protein [Elusimicrobia bacterium]|nr:oligosaccharide flippase family protein [Candidatus Liberimonas magnetica]
MNIPIINWINDKEEQLLSGDTSNARFMRGTFWLTTSTIVSLLLGMISSILIARMLDKTLFGQFGMVVNTISMLGTFTGLGLGLTTLKYVAEFKSTDPSRASRIMDITNKITIFSGGAISLALFIFAEPLSSRVLNAPELATMLRLGTFLLFFNTLNGTQTGALSGLESFKVIAKINALKGILYCPIVIIGTYFFGLSGAVASVVVWGFVGWFLNHIALKSECKKANLPIDTGNIFDELPILWKFTLPAFIGGALVGPVLWIANTILANQPGGYGELGLVNASNQWRNFIVMLPSIFCSAALPILSSEQNSKPGNCGTLDITQKVTISIILPFFTITLFLGDFIMGLYGKSFSAGYPVLVGITFAICLMAIANVGGTSLTASGRMWTGLFYNLAWGLIFVGFVYKYAAIGGAKAYALGYAVAYAALFGLMFLYLKSIFSKHTLLLMISSIVYLSLLTMFSLNLSIKNRFIFFAPFMLFSMIVSYIVLGKTYSLKIINRILAVIPKKNAIQL